MLDKIAQHFKTNFPIYENLSQDELQSHLENNPEILDNAMSHIAENGHDDPQLNDAAVLHGINKIVTDNPEIHPDELAQKISKTHGKPLVNWFNRQKEFEYSNPTDAKGNTIIDKNSGKPLEKTIKRVTAPDSVLSSGFTKTVTDEQKNETTTTGGKRVNIGLPFPTMSLPIVGAMFGNFVANSVMNNGKGFSSAHSGKLSEVLPSYLGMLAGGSAGMVGVANLWKKYDMTFINKKTTPLGSGFLTDAKSLTGGALEIATGVPVNLFGHDVIIPKKQNTKVINERTKEKVNNPSEGDIKLSPRFL